MTDAQQGVLKWPMVEWRVRGAAYGARKEPRMRNRLRRETRRKEREEGAIVVHGGTAE